MPAIRHKQNRPSPKPPVAGRRVGSRGEIPAAQRKRPGGHSRGTLDGCRIKSRVREHARAEPGEKFQHVFHGRIRAQIARKAQRFERVCGRKRVGGAGRNRTADKGFADLCLTTWRPRRLLVARANHTIGSARKCIEDSYASDLLVSNGTGNENVGREKRMKANQRRSAAKGVHALPVRTTRRTELQDVTDQIAAAVRESGCPDGVCHLYVPHTTAGVTINEGYDPAVAQDIAAEFERLVPRLRNSAHAEGNSDSHMKKALVGSAESARS